jgi:hypothetical protein
VLLQYSPQWSDPDAEFLDCDIADPVAEFTSPFGPNGLRGPRVLQSQVLRKTLLH